MLPPCFVHSSRAFAALILLPCGLSRADQNVVVSSTANPAYTQQKFGGENIRRETYVVMQGHRFDGLTVDRSFERTPFLNIVNFFAPELARRQYWPAKNASEADLLIIVHWGTTTRQGTADELRARDSAATDMRESADVIRKNIMVDLAAQTPQVGATAFLELGDPVTEQHEMDNLDVMGDLARTDLNHATSAQLLGYTKELRELSAHAGISTTDAMLRSDLNSERYFIILKAYALHEKIPAGSVRRAVWTLHLNMRSPGINFQTALDRMSATAVDYFGRTTDEVQTVSPRLREGKVEVGAPVVISAKK